MFRFFSPTYLYLLLILPILVGLFYYYRMRYEKRVEKFGKWNTVKLLMPQLSTLRSKYKFILFICAIAVLIFALARPQFGSKLRENKVRGIEMILVVDVSNSMLAQDYQPTRLERTKFAISKLLDKTAQNRIGMVVFAGEAFVQLPVTADFVSARNFVDNLSTGMVTVQGTAIGKAISLASRSFTPESENSRIIVLISDGEDHQDDAVKAAEEAAKQGIVIYTIGIGTPEGSPVKVGDEFLKDKDGNTVVSKLNEDILKKIAFSTNGAYIRATNKSIGLDEIMAQIDQMEKKEFEAKVFEDYNDQFQYLIAIVLILLILELILLERKSGIAAKFNIFVK